MSLRFGWWEALAFTHRWLGIAGCLLILLWYVSGIAMMYVRMPALTAEERLAHLAVLEVPAIKVSLADAAAGASGASVQLAMLGTRPVYRFGGRTPSAVFADTGERVEMLSEESAISVARDFASNRSTTLRYAGLLSNPDQWTLHCWICPTLQFVNIVNAVDESGSLLARQPTFLPNAGVEGG